MILRLLAYGCLALAALNIAENTGLVEKDRYLTFLPRWQDNGGFSRLVAGARATITGGPSSSHADFVAEAKALPATVKDKVTEKTDELGTFITEKSKGH